MPELIVRIIGDTKGLDKSFKQASKSASSFDRSMKNTTRGVVAATASFTGLRRGMLSTSAAFIGGAGLTAAFASTVRIAATFEQTMNILQATTEATTAQMTAASRAAQKLGADFTLPAVSAADAAVAMTELAKGGLSVEQAIEAARGTLQLAAAAGTDVGTAAAITARQLNAFGLSGDEAGRVADVLANASKSATGEITDFAFAFQQSATVAHQFGLSVEDTATALTIFAKAGTIGSDAGTSLRVMLSRLVPSTAKAEKLFEDLHLQLQTANGDFLPLRAQIIQFQKALAALAPVERQRAVNTIFGQDAQRAANLILLQGVDAYDKMREAIGKQGTAQKLAEARSKGFTGAVNAFKSALETTQITLGLKLLPALTDYLEQSAKWLGDTENQKRLQHDFSEAIDVVSSAVKVLVSTVKVANEVFQEFSKLMGSSAKALGAIAIALAGFKFRGVISGIVGIGTEAQASTAKVSLLRKRLILLGGIVIPAIAIPIIIDLSEKGKRDARVNDPGGLQGALRQVPLLGTFDRAMSKLAFDITDKLGLTTKKTAADLKQSLTHFKIDPITGEVSTFVLGVAGKMAKAVKDTSGDATKILNTAIQKSGLAALTPEQRNALELAAAALTKSNVDDLKALREQRAILAGEIARTRDSLAAATGKTAEDLADKLETLINSDAQAFNRIVSINEEAAATAKTAADKAKAARKKAFEAVRDLFDTGQSAEARKALFDKASVEFDVHEAVTDAIRDRAERIRAERDKRQFRSLGLSAAGDRPVPQLENLRAQATQLTEAISGTFLDDTKTKGILGRIRSTLKGAVDGMSKDVRSTVRDMLADLRKQLKEGAGGAETKFRTTNVRNILQAAGLDPDDVKRASFALSRRGPGGTIPGAGRGAFGMAVGQPIVVKTQINLDGRQVALSTTKHQQTRRRRNPAQKRGPNAGGPQ